MKKTKYLMPVLLVYALVFVGSSFGSETRLKNVASSHVEYCNREVKITYRNEDSKTEKKYEHYFDEEEDVNFFKLSSDETMLLAVGDHKICLFCLDSNKERENPMNFFRTDCTILDAVISECKHGIAIVGCRDDQQNGRAYVIAIYSSMRGIKLREINVDRVLTNLVFPKGALCLEGVVDGKHMGYHFNDGCFYEK
ncbi:MAG: hypothetical protein H6679_00900 [Epsilonproteobacteria bacterium]|nr:hypothetical protein [Campylobacterota bacterium]